MSITASHPVCGPHNALRGRRSGRGERFRAASGGEGFGCLPFAWVHAGLDGGGDEVRERVGLVLGNLVEGAPRERTVAAEPAREPEQ